MGTTSDNKAEAFRQKMVAILNQGALNLAISIGYQTGLFEVMANIGGPADAETISAKSGLNTRYVREWLGIMTAGRIVELVQDAVREEAYQLPAEHAACLTRSAGNQNLAVYAQEIPLLTATAMSEVVADFRRGDGLPYSIYPRFQAFMSELSNAKHCEILVNKFLPSVAGGDLVRKLQQGIEVCDVGCGEGVALQLMAEAYPNSRFTGVDISEDAIAAANRRKASRSLANTEFIQIDAASLQEDPRWRRTFDYIVAFDAIHDQAAPLRTLAGIYRMLSGGGMFSMVDIAAGSALRDNLDHPMGPFLYAVSLMHCLPVGLHQGGEGLGMMWGKEKATGYLRRAGFEQIEVHEMDHDPFNYHYFCKKNN